MAHGKRAGEATLAPVMSENRHAAIVSLKAAYERALSVGDSREADLEWIFERAAESDLPDETIAAVVQDVARGKLQRAITRLA